MYDAVLSYAQLEPQDLFDLCMALARKNVRYLVDHPETARLYELARAGRVRYKDEARRVCDGDVCRVVDAKWKDIPTGLEDGTIDCKSAVAWWVAECWIDGRDAVPLIRCIDCGIRSCPRCQRTKSGRTWHVQGLEGSGRVEDPSRVLGMRPHPRGDDYLVATYDQAGIVRI